MELTEGREATVCGVCGRRFEPRFSFQQQERDGALVAFCSTRCRLAALASPVPVVCSACGAEFAVEYAFQTAVLDGRERHFCSMECRGAGPAKPPPLRRLAVYSLKGGTGKTTTAVSLAAGLARMGYRVLLVDVDPQGSVAVSLGITVGRGLYQVLVLGAAPETCAVEARPDLHVIPANRALAGAEIYLAGRPERYRLLHDRLASVTGYDVTIIDCSPSAGLLSQNALRLADAVLVPVSCEYLGLVGLELAIRVLGELKARTGHEVTLAGVLPTFLDRRLNVCHDALAELERRHPGLVLPAIRTSARIKEAPAAGQTIGELDPKSKGAEDYEALARWFASRYLDAKDTTAEVPHAVVSVAAGLARDRSVGARM